MSLRERLRVAETRLLQRFPRPERHGVLRAFMLVATRLADGWALAILIPLAVVLGGWSRGVAAIGLGTVSAVSIAVVVQSIKAVVRRRRPMGVDVDRPIAAPDKHAFPSGHTAQAWGMVLITWWLSPPVGAVLLVASVAVALSRMFFGLHYPTDVVVGALLGLLIAWLTIRLGTEWGLVAWLLGISPA